MFELHKKKRKPEIARLKKMGMLMFLAEVVGWKES